MIFSCPNQDNSASLSSYNIGVTQRSLSKLIKLPSLPDIKLGLDGDEDDDFKDALSDEE